MDLELKRKLLIAVESNKPVETLMTTANMLKDAGWIQQKIHALFLDFLRFILENGIEEQEDAVRDVLDFITGWCSPHMQLFEDNHLFNHAE